MFLQKLSPIQLLALTTTGVVLVVGGVYYVLRKDAPAPQSGVQVEGTGDFTVEEIDTSTIPPPSASRPIIITADLPADAKVILRAKMEELSAQLRQEPRQVALWLKLGGYRKIGGDYQGAIEAWNYVGEAAPLSVAFVAYGNLGDLYMNFVKDYALAEQSYLTAITMKPDVIDYYRNLYYLYRDLLKNPTKAKAIVEQGLKANPGDPDLLRLQ